MKRVLIAFLLLPSMVWAAAPTVSTVTGTTTLTISGSGFGTKSTAAPLMWDNFEQGTNGADVGTSTNGASWSLHGANDATYTSVNNKTGSTLCASQYLSGSADNYMLYAPGVQLTKVYVSFWIRYDVGNVSDNSQIKVWRFCHDYAGSASPGVANFTRPLLSPNGSFYYNLRSSAINDDASDFTSYKYVDNAWCQVEVQAYIGTTNTADGSVEIWKSEAPSSIRKIVNRSSVNLRGSEVGAWDNFMFGEYVAGASNNATPLYDDIYIDSTWQRVVIGDNETYANCTVREVQIPITGHWSDTEIQCTYNAGSLAGDKYLFVVNDAGEVSEGVLLGSTPAPAPPTISNATISNGRVQ